MSYRVGDAVAGGQLKTIGSDRVAIDRRDGQINVMLKDPTKPAPPAAVAERAAGRGGSAAEPRAGGPTPPAVRPQRTANPFAPLVSAQQPGARRRGRIFPRRFRSSRFRPNADDSEGGRAPLPTSSRASRRAPPASPRNRIAPAEPAPRTRNDRTFGRRAGNRDIFTRSKPALEAECTAVAVCVVPSGLPHGPCRPSIIPFGSCAILTAAGEPFPRRSSSSARSLHPVKESP